jgi:hypothetical protein
MSVEEKDKMIAEINEALDNEQKTREEELEKDKDTDIDETEEEEQQEDTDSVDGEEVSSDIDDSKEIKDTDTKEDESSLDLPTIDDYTLTKAVQAGIPLHVARSFPSDDALLMVIASIEGKAKKPEEEKGEEDLFKNFPELKEDETPAEILQAINGFKDIIKKQYEEINKLKSQTNEIENSGMEAAAREVKDWFDKKVNGLGEDFEEVLGKGDYNSLDPRSQQFAKREELANQLSVLIAGYNATGKRLPPRDELFDVAAALVLADKFEDIDKKKLTEKLSKRSGQHIQRAGGNKNKKTLNPFEEVAAEMDAKYYGK